jgi:hypothetical protein
VQLPFRRQPKPPLAAEPGATTGTVKAAALAILGALVYTFEWSLDQQSWTSATTRKCSYLVTGLTPGKLYYFRVKAFLRDDTTTDYVATVSLIVR